MNTQRRSKRRIVFVVYSLLFSFLFIVLFCVSFNNAEDTFNLLVYSWADGSCSAARRYQLDQIFSGCRGKKNAEESSRATICLGVALTPSRALVCIVIAAEVDNGRRWWMLVDAAAACWHLLHDMASNSFRFNWLVSESLPKCADHWFRNHYHNRTE